MSLPEIDSFFYVADNLSSQSKGKVKMKIVKARTGGSYKLSPKVTDHKAVAECCEAGEDGIRYDVLLKDGYHFAALDCNAGRDDWQTMRRTGLFKSIKDFLDADPRPFDH